MKQTLGRYREAVAVSALLLVAILLWLPRLNGPIDLRYDAGVYYSLGTALAEGKGYRLLNEPGAIHAIQYPPLLAVFAAVHQRLAGSSDPAVAGHWLRISFLAITLAFIAAAYRLSRKLLSCGLAFLAVLGTLLQVQTLWMSELFFAELPFALAGLLFLLAARGANTKGRECLAGAMAVTCFLLRSSGIAVLGAWVAESVFQRDFRKAAIRAGVALIPFVAWQSYILHVKHGPEYARPSYSYQRADYLYYNVGYVENASYVDPFKPELGKQTAAMLGKRIFANVIQFPQSLGEAVSVRADWAHHWLENFEDRFGVRSIPVFLVDALPFMILGTLVIAGSVLLALKGEGLLCFYLGISAALICATPWAGQFERYLWPLTPVLCVALLLSLTALEGKLRVPHKALVAGFVLAIGTVEFVALHKTLDLSSRAFYTDGTGRRREHRVLFYPLEWRYFDEAADWLKSHAARDEIIATSAPQWVYLKSGLLAVMPPFENSASQAQTLMDSVPVRYLIVDNMNWVDVSRRYAQPVVEAYSEKWELIYTAGNGSSKIYRRVEGGR